LSYVKDLTDAQIADAAARVAENRCLIAWVRAAIAARIDSYRYALEHAFVAMPQREAIEAERTIKALDIHRHSLDGLPVPAWSSGACMNPPVVERRIKVPLVTKG
jgi:hypothetical protein